MLNITLDTPRVSLDKKSAYNAAVAAFEADDTLTYYVVTADDLGIAPDSFKFQSVKSTLTTYAATRTNGLTVHSGTDDDTDTRVVVMLPADYTDRVEAATEAAEAAQTA